MDKQLLERYFTGGVCTTSELQEIKAYMEQPGQELAEFLSEEWEQAGGLENVNRRENSWNAVLTAIGQSEPIPVYEMYSRRFKRSRYWIAAVIILIAGSIVYYGLHNKYPAAREAMAVHWKNVHNQSEQVQFVRMPDGSVIWLNSQSSLSYPGNYGADNIRQVKVSGEAFFDIAKDASHPFIIYADSLQTKVLGTSFAIRAWPRTPGIQVALVTGSVQVSGLNNTINEKLMPGDLLEYSKLNKKISKTSGGIRPDMYEWKDGKIVLSNTPVVTALEQLQQQYNVTFHYDAQKIGNRKLTGKFRREGIGSVLQNILFAAGLTYSIKDGVYYITAE